MVIYTIYISVLQKQMLNFAAIVLTQECGKNHPFYKPIMKFNVFCDGQKIVIFKILTNYVRIDFS